MSTVKVTAPHSAGYVESVTDVASFPKGFVERHPQEIDAVIEGSYYEIHLQVKNVLKITNEKIES